MSVHEGCSVGDCQKPVKGRGKCGMHYQRELDGRTVDAPQTWFPNPAEAFAHRTAREGECLVWLGSRTNDGYGQLQVRGRLVRAHRYAWEVENGPIPEGMFLDHICHNPPCCELSHLRVVSNAENRQNLTGAYRNSETGIRGVYRRGSRFLARYQLNGKQVRVGMFNTAMEAEAAVIEARRRMMPFSVTDQEAGSA